MNNDKVLIRTILLDNIVIGHIAKFIMFGDPEITYWIDREFWGKGYTTLALKLFLSEIIERPLYARAALDNVGSIRVLEKSGFVKVRVEKGYANARKEEIDEVVMCLD
ncbi:MAG: GNAT family N-acetyltransferase [Candidatus Heimdallarchaeota archaeon]|nr:GNAT family N-acetyltransferase [Candidatus Heimdallarchaeota archaeon]